MTLPLGQVAFTPELALDIWIAAANREMGLIVPVADAKDCEAISKSLYEARRDISDPRLANLSLHISEDGREIYVYKKEVDLDD